MGRSLEALPALMIERLELDGRAARAIATRRSPELGAVAGGAIADLALFRRFARGEQDAVATARNMIRQVVQHRGYYIPSDERPDIVQETMIDVLLALRDSRFSRDEDFIGFLRTISHRRCVDWMRRRRRRHRPAASAVQMFLGPDDRLLAKERRELATEVVSKLGEPCRGLVSLHAVGVTYGQLAERYGRSEGALRTQAYECLKQARRLLDRLSRRRRFTRIDGRAAG
jgi:RNA polymerase sigma factor (sigma-70 family)